MRAQPFRHTFEHLLAELGRIDLLLEHALERTTGGAAPATSGATVAPSQNGPAAVGTEVAAARRSRSSSSTTRWKRALARLEAANARRCRLSVAAGVELRLIDLAEAFSLTSLDVDLLLLAVAPEIDRHYGPMFAALQQDPAAMRPTVGLALELLAGDPSSRLLLRSRLAEAAPLLRFRLLEWTADERDRRVPFPNWPLRVDPRILSYLQHLQDVPRALFGLVREVPSRPCELEELPIDPQLRVRLARLAQDLVRAGSGEALLPVVHGRGAAPDIAPPLPLLYLEGPHGCGAEQLARSLCHRIGAGLLEVDGGAAIELSPESFALRLELLFREARLSGAGLLWGDFDLLLAESRRAQRLALLEAVRSWRPLLFCSGKMAFEPAADELPGAFIRIRLGIPPVSLRRQVFKRAIAETGMAVRGEIDTAIDPFELTPDRIRDAVNTARDHALWRDPEATILSPADLLEGCRRQSAPNLGKLAQRLETARAWEDLVVNGRTLALLRELREQVQHRGRLLDEWGYRERLSSSGGVVAMFCGPSGTGKTLAAAVLGRAVGRDVYRIDLSCVVSKYIGETEKQLAHLFDEAESSSALLFFDEADALFGKRTEVREAHDRFANIETSYLLQRIEAFRGGVILATNLRNNLDPAFTRRMSFIIPFEPPTATERREIWARIWPDLVPLANDVNIDLLATRFELTGGNIHNIALAAACRAVAANGPVTMAHILHAVRRELEKTGRVVDNRQFEPG